MNGTLLLRRSASMVLASSLLLVAACGIELNGLFEDDAGSDAAVRSDARQDAPATTDRAPDVRADATSDEGSTDNRSMDVSIDERGGGDATIDASVDAGNGDATMDASLDADARSDAGIDSDASRETSVDAEAGRDIVGDPFQDATEEDIATEPHLDVPIETTADAVADATADTSRDGADAGSPGTCFGPCNTFDNISQTITRTVDSGPPPTMTGGTLVDGTYVVTGIVQYNDDTTPFSLAETSIISGNFDTWVASTNGQAQIRYSSTITATNSQLEFTFCCPTGGNLTISYTTDGTTLTHVDAGNPNRVITYTRQ